jgi:hypothetical protein
VDTHVAAVRLKLAEWSLFQILMLEMFQMNVRTHDERNLLSHQRLERADGLNCCKQIKILYAPNHSKLST